MENKKYEHDILFLIKQATLAPSGHNTQPWLFRRVCDTIEIHPDRSKSLDTVDPDHREIFISLGCALENLCIAAHAKGYKTEIAITTDGIISVHVTSGPSTSDLSNLATCIIKRQTNRSVYTGHLIDNETIHQLQNLPVEGTTRVHYWKRETNEYELITNYVLKGNAIQMDDKAFKQELCSWIRYNRKQTDSTRDGLSYAVFGAPNLPAPISRIIMNAYLNPATQNRGDRKKISSSSHFVLFTTQSDRIEDWIQLGQTLQRFLLKSTELGLACAFSNQPCELKELSVQMKQDLKLVNEHPALLLRTGYAKPMPYSCRKNVDEVCL